MNRLKIDKELSKINPKYYLEEALAPVFYKKLQDILNQFIENERPLLKLVKWFKGMKLLFNLLLFIYFITLFFCWNDFHFFFIVNILLVLLIFFVKTIAYNEKEPAQEMQEIYKPIFSKFLFESITPASALLLLNNTIFFSISTGSFWLGLIFVLLVLIFNIFILDSWFALNKKSEPAIRKYFHDFLFFLYLIGALLSASYPLVYSAEDINKESLEIIYLFYSFLGSWLVFTFFIWQLYLGTSNKKEYKYSKIKNKKINSLFSTLQGSTILSINKISEEIDELKLKLDEQEGKIETTQEELDLKINAFFNSDLKIQSDGCAQNFDNLKHHLPKRAILVCEELIDIYSQKQKNIDCNIELFQEIIKQRTIEKQNRIQIVTRLEDIDGEIEKEKKSLQSNKKEDERLDHLIVDLKEELGEFSNENTKNLENVIYLVDSEKQRTTKFEKSYEFRRQQKQLDKKLEQVKKQSDFYKLKMTIYDDLLEKYKTEENITDFTGNLKTLIEDFKDSEKK